MNRRILATTILLVAAVGCDSGEPSTAQGQDSPGTGGVLGDEMPEDLPAGVCAEGDTDTEDCESSTAGSSGSPAAQDAAAGVSECASTEDCDGAGACAAEWGEDGRTSFACRFACIPTLDEVAWCRDDASCCDADAVCTGRGYCVVPESSDSDGADNIGGSPKLSDEMPEDLPAGGGTPDGVLSGDSKDLP